MLVLFSMHKENTENIRMTKFSFEGWANRKKHFFLKITTCLNFEMKSVFIRLKKELSGQSWNSEIRGRILVLK